MNEDDRVTLRAVVEDDLPIFFAQQQDYKANRLAAVPARDRDDFWEHWHKNMANEDVILRTILNGEQLAGNVVSWEEEGKRKIGYWLGQAYWGKGIGSAAVAQFLEEVVERPLYADVAQHNAASFRILQKCGFEVIAEEIGGYGPDDDEEVAMYIMRLGAASGE